MSYSTLFECGAVCLEAVGKTASWRRTRPNVDQYGRWAPMVVIQTSSASDEGVFTPAECVTVSGADALRALRDAIDEALKYEMTPPAGEKGAT